MNDLQDLDAAAVARLVRDGIELGTADDKIFGRHTNPLYPPSPFPALTGYVAAFFATRFARVMLGRDESSQHSIHPSTHAINSASCCIHAWGTFQIQS